MKILKNILFLFLLVQFTALSQTAYTDYAYEENFNGKNSWPQGSNDRRELKIYNGRYYFEHKKTESNWQVITPTVNLDKLRDFEIETSIQKISGVQNSAISFIFDYKDNKNYREFSFTATGYYRVTEVINNSYKNIKAWTKSDKVKTGNYSVNNLKVIKKGLDITFYINGTNLFNINNKSFIGKQLGIAIFKNQKISIDFIRAKYLSSKKTSPAKNKTILFEGFTDNTNNWATTNTNDALLEIKNGDYIFEHKRETSGWNSTITKKIDVTKDFRISTEIKKISGINNNGFGLTFGGVDNDNQNEFFISSDGSFMIRKHEKGKLTIIKKWTKSEHIKQGNTAYNYLKIEKIGIATKFYINNNLVYTSYSCNYSGSRIGYIVYHRQKIAIGYLKIEYIKSATKPVITTKLSNIFSDNFSSNKNSWYTKQDDLVDMAVNNGKYYFEYKKDAGYSTNQLIAIDRSRNFKIEASIQKISGVQNYGYGLIFGRSNSNNQNQFQISAGGSFTVTSYNNGDFKTNKSWTKSTVIKTGNYATNKLTIKKIGSRYDFYINDIKVYTDYNIKLFGERQGFILFNKQKIAIDNFNISYLDQKDKNSNNNSNIVLEENFNNNNNPWSNSENEKYKFKVENGQFTINHKQNTSGYTSSIKKYINTLRNFEIETKIKKVGGVSNYPYGIKWGGNEKNDFRFYIANSGYYKLVRIVENKEQVIKKWTTTSAINKNIGTSNVLKVKKEGNRYSFYINNIYVDKTDFENFHGNEIGFVIYNKQEISVDYLNVKYLKEPKINTNKKLTIPLREDFYTNKNNWFIGGNEKYSSSLSNNQLIIHRKEKGGLLISKEIKVNDEKDFVIETTITDKSTFSDGYYGFTFGRKNDANEFSFLLSKNGTYKYRKFENNNYTEIIKNTSSSAIKTSINAKNTIKIEKAGNLLRFYINGQYVNEAPFQSFFGDIFGYVVYYNKKIGVNYLDIKYRSDNFNNPPEVTILSPDVVKTRGFKIVKVNTIQVKGIATDKDGIFEITVNGKEAYVTGNGNFTANVPLIYGDNTLIVKATDLKQKSSIKKFVIRRKSPEQIPDIENNLDNIITGKYHALIIGVGDYIDDSLDLDKDPSKGSPTEDAENLYRVLTTKYNFDKSNVVYLKNPTEKEINRNFVMLRSRVGKNDSVLIFYAGHGSYDSKTERGYWMPSDFEKKFEDNVVLNTDIVNHIAKIPSKHTLLISDSCFSGSIFNSSSRGFTKAEKRIKRIFNLKSRKAMTSGTLKTVPNKSMFFKYLLQNLEQNEEKYLTSRKLFDRLLEPVMDLTKNIPQSGTVYNTGHEGGDFIFIKKN